MNQDIFFMPLGGGQTVGASCYYLRLGNSNIILDAGIGNDSGLIFEPNLHALLTSPYIQSLNQINQIFISHAHTDHVGYLLKLMSQMDRPSVYMTGITKLLAQFQLYDKAFMTGRANSENQRLAAQSLFDKIITVNYMQTLDFGNYKVKLLQAGHIPGAMMMLFEFGNRKILYTGDYSLNSTILTDGCMLSDEGHIDTVIMCGLHAKHPEYKVKRDSAYRQANYILNTVAKEKKSIICIVPQLSKGIEFIKIMNEKNKHNIPICIDDSIMRVIDKMERLHVPILDRNNHVADYDCGRQPFIYVTAKPDKTMQSYYDSINVDFSLHDDINDMKQFIKRLNPKYVYLVHCAENRDCDDYTIKQIMMRDGEINTQFVFVEDEQLYKL